MAAGANSVVEVHRSETAGARRRPPALSALLQCVLGAAIALGLFSADAKAQTSLPTPPPVFSTVDANGVDLVTGAFNFSTLEVAIGQPGAGGLAYVRTYIGPGWRDNYVGAINSSGSVYTVSVGGSSETFTLSGGVYTSDQAVGSSLSVNSGIYTYTMSNGTAALFDTALANGGAVWDANVARITTLTMASGEQVAFHYRSVTIQSVAAMRLQSVTNNFGYQLHFDYSLNSPTLSSQLTAWKTITQVTGINTAVDYCDPDADTCSGLTVAWPSATYSLSGSGDVYETVTDALSRATRYTVSAPGLIAIRRPPSTTTDHVNIQYVSGRVSRVTRGSEVWTYAYSDNAGVRTTTVTDSLSNTRVVVSTIATNEVASDTDGESRTISYQYDANHRVTRATMPEGNYTALSYDSRGNVTEARQTAKSGSGLSDIVTTATYASNCANPATCNQALSMTDARGATTDFTYDSTHGGVLTVTAPDPDGAGSAVRPQTRYTYSSLYAYFKNSGGSIVAAATPVYRLTGISACAVTSSCSGGADETVTTIGYGATGVANNRLPLTASAGAGDGSLTATATQTYDAVGNLLTVDGPLAGADDVTRYRYDAGRQIIGVIGPDPDGAGALHHRATRVTYNADGQPTMVAQGTVDSQSDGDWAAFASLQQLNTTYDFLGRPTLRTMTAGGVTHAAVQLSYDAAGRLDCAALRMNPALYAALPASACTLGMVGLHGPDRITRNTYNHANQITKVTSGYGTPAQIDDWTATFTSNGRMATLADAGGNLTTYEYDGFDRLRKIRFPNATGGGSSTSDYEQYTYDAASNVTQVRRRDGTTIASTFDALNRVTLSDVSSNGDDISASYDNFSRPLTRSFSGHTLTFVYDQLSRLTSQQSPLGTVSTQYDLAGRRTRVTWPDSYYAQYDYDLAGAVTAIRENGAGSGAGVLATYAYDNLARRISVARGNGTTETADFDDAGRLEELAQNLTGTGNDQTLTFTYNSASQIVSRTGSDADFAWAPIAPATINYADNGLNQYSSVGGTNQAYDSRGNLTTGSFGYDIDNQLTSGPGSATLAYDPTGRLYETVGAGVATRFLYDGASIIGEYNGSGTLQRRFVHGPGIDEPIVWYEGAGTSDRRWLIADERGSIIAVTDASGAAININTYDEYGIPGAANAGRFQYTGQAWLPEVSLHHYRARAYAPNTGRFLQSDPILQAGGMNLYAYVGNDAVNLVDPTGLACSETWFFTQTQNGVVQAQWTQRVNRCGITIPPGGGGSSTPDRGGGGGGNGGDGGNDEPPGDPPRCLRPSDGPVFFEGAGVDLVLVLGVGFGFYHFDVPSVGASGVVASGAGLGGLGGSAGFTGGRVDTMGNFLGRGWRIDSEMFGFPALGVQFLFSDSGYPSGNGVSIAGGGGLYGGRTQTRLLSSNIPLCSN